MNSNAVAFTILGEPASKANSREIVTRNMRDAWGLMKTRPMVIKSGKAREYERTALLQIPADARAELTGPVRITLRIYYASNRPDLDETLILDVLQSKYHTVMQRGREVRECLRKGCYINDRQIVQKFVFKAIDAVNPRAEIVIEPLQAQQIALALEPDYDPFEAIA